MKVVPTKMAKHLSIDLNLQIEASVCHPLTDKIHFVVNWKIR